MLPPGRPWVHSKNVSKFGQLLLKYIYILYTNICNQSIIQFKKTNKHPHTQCFMDHLTLTNLQ